MSHPPVPGLPPQPQPPLTYGGYGGELQHYQPQGYPLYPPVASAPPASVAWPYPAMPAPPEGTVQTVQPPQRPAVVTMAATLAVTASLQFIGALSVLWLLAVAADQELGTTGADGVMFHILNRFNDRMLIGLAWPLYLFPMSSFVLGLLLLTRRPWARWAFSVLGLAAVVWLAWLFRSDLQWLIVPGIYVAFCVGILWTAAARRWYSWSAGSHAHPQPG